MKFVPTPMSARPSYAEAWQIAKAIRHLHLDCRFVIHHDLSWNPSTIEQRTGRVDRIGAKSERARQPIHVYLPYVTATQDEKMFRVVRDRELGFP